MAVSESFGIEPERVAVHVDLAGQQVEALAKTGERIGGIEVTGSLA